MPPRLILNADDFGLTHGINRAIAELHDASALTSATLMATGPAFDDAVAIALARPTLGVGCHIVLTDGTPILPPHEIPSLIGSDGRNFRPSLGRHTLAVLLSQVKEDDIEREALAQIQHLQRAGIHVTHADTHKHAHMFSRVARPLLRALQQANIPAIRNPFEPLWAVRSGRNLRRRFFVAAFSRLRKRFRKHPAIASGKILTTDGTLGISATGDLNAASLQKLLTAMPEGLWELVCHPGYNDRDLDAITTRLRTEREVELHALLNAFNKTAQLSHAELIHYGSLNKAVAATGHNLVPTTTETFT
jgi:chitin disaccharide deacetylase